MGGDRIGMCIVVVLALGSDFGSDYADSAFSLVVQLFLPVARASCYFASQPISLAAPTSLHYYHSRTPG